MKKQDQEKEIINNKKQKKVFNSISFVIVCGLFVVAAILIGQLLFDNGVISTNEFYENTSINGIDVSGMNKNEAYQLISARLLSNKDQIQIKLKYQEKEWILKGTDFVIDNDIMPAVEKAFSIGRQGATAKRVATVKNIKTNGLRESISYRYVLGGFDSKIDEIIKEINILPKNQEIIFNPNAEKSEMFTISKGEKGILVDKEKLYYLIDQAFKNSLQIEIDIPTYEEPFEMLEKDAIQNIKLRSSFETDYSSSVDGRKNNVKVALKSFNGMVVNPGEEVSFNLVTGDKTPENGYQKAKIILNGVYVDGYGGGACQASTTLYNALILADLEILEVNPHSLPVSYVPLAFDAMVSEGYSDLRFKNNLEKPIYLKTWGDNQKAYVEIYGQAFDDGVEIKRRAEFIETIPHEGDVIVKDENKEYANQITYLGEYLRIRYPREGYHSKAYLEYYKNGELISQKLIRDEYYYPQKGLVMEGTEVLGEGMTLPPNTVKIIPPQEIKTKTNENNVNKKITQDNPSEYNP